MGTGNPRFCGDEEYPPALIRLVDKPNCTINAYNHRQKPSASEDKAGWLQRGAELLRFLHLCSCSKHFLSLAGSYVFGFAVGFSSPAESGILEDLGLTSAEGELPLVGNTAPNIEAETICDQEFIKDA
ncbi:hypothetical protein ACS0TY_034535 [Phlomoides rotata]